MPAADREGRGTGIGLGLPPRPAYIAAMIVLAALLLGAFLGWRRAAAIGGNAKDRAQYAAVFAILFALAGLFATILVSRVTG